MTYPWVVLRSLLTPRWVGMLLLLVLVVTACVLLGLWQLGVARDEGRREAVAAASRLERAPLHEVTRPHAPFAAELSNRPVTVTGTYAADRSFVVVDRRLDGRVGSWVVTPLETDRGTVAVLRGFVDGIPSGRDLPPTPAGVVSVAGTLGPGESPRPGDPLPAPQRRAIDLAQLVNEWPGDLYNVVVLASAETAGETPGAGTPVPTPGLSRVPPPDLDAPLNLRNAAYAVQWWVFGVFAIWMWWKMFRAEQPAASRPAPREGVSA